MVEIQETARKPLIKAKKLRQIAKLAKEMKIAPHTLANVAKKGFAIARVAAKINDHFAPKPTMQRNAIEVICEYYNITPDELPLRKNAEARMIAAAMLSITTKLTKTDIAKELQYKSHSDVSHRMDEYKDRMLNNGEFILKVTKIRTLIGV